MSRCTTPSRCRKYTAEAIWNFHEKPVKAFLFQAQQTRVRFHTKSQFAQHCFQVAYFYILHNFSVCVVAKDIANGAEDLRLDSRIGQIGQCRQRLAAMFFRKCVAQALSYGDSPRHSLHVSA